MEPRPQLQLQRYNNDQPLPPVVPPELQEAILGGGGGGGGGGGDGNSIGGGSRKNTVSINDDKKQKSKNSNNNDIDTDIVVDDDDDDGMILLEDREISATTTSNSNNDTSIDEQDIFQTYLYHLLYAAQQLLQTSDDCNSVNTTSTMDDNDAVMEFTTTSTTSTPSSSSIGSSTTTTVKDELERQFHKQIEQHRMHHTKQVEAFILGRKEKSGSTTSSATATTIRSLFHQLIAVVLQMGQLEFISQPISLQQYHFFFPPRPPDHIYYANDVRPERNNTSNDTTSTNTTTATAGMNQNDNSDDNDIRSDATTTSSGYQYRRIDIVRRLLRSMAPIAMDMVAHMVHQQQQKQERHIVNHPHIDHDVNDDRRENSSMDTSSNDSSSSHSNSVATFIIIGIWLPIAPHILPLVTHFIQQQQELIGTIPLDGGNTQCDDTEKEEVDNKRNVESSQLSSSSPPWLLHHPLHLAKQLWMQSIPSEHPKSSSSCPTAAPVLSTPAMIASSSTTTVTNKSRINLQQIVIIMEVTWMICQVYKQQQNSQTLRNGTTSSSSSALGNSGRNDNNSNEHQQWWWNPILMWLQYTSIGVPQSNHDLTQQNSNNNEEVGEDMRPQHDRRTVTTTTTTANDNLQLDGPDAMLIDPPQLSQDAMMVVDDKNEDDEVVFSNSSNQCGDTDNEDQQQETRRKFRLTRDEWTLEIQIMWYVIRIIAYLRNYTPVYTQHLLLRYNVYYHHHYVPWHIHDYDKNDEETYYQHLHAILKCTHLSPYLSYKDHKVLLPDIETVRIFIPLHPYLVHLGRGLVFVKHPLLPTTTIDVGMDDTTLDDDRISHATQQQQQQRLIRTFTTNKNLYEIGTILCIQPPVPILIAGPNGSGKSSLIRELACEFHNTDSILRDIQSSSPPLLEIHVDEETDTKTLVGSYTVTDIPGEFEWRPGALTSAVISGQWVLLEDFDTIPIDIQASLESLFKHRTLSLGNGTTIICHPNFRLFGTITATTTSVVNTACVDNQNDAEHHKKNRSVIRPKMTVGRGRRLFNASIWTTIYVDPLPLNELKEIVLNKFTNIPTKILDATLSIFYALLDDPYRSRSQINDNTNNNVDNDNGFVVTCKKKLWLGRSPSVRDLFKALSRISNGIQFERNASYATESQRTLCLAEIVDVFVAACPNPSIRREFITQIVAPILNITADLGISYVEHRQPTIISHETSTEIGRVQIVVTPEQGEARSTSEQFAQTSYSLRMMESIGVCIRENEPTLLVGETGTGKTTILQHLAKCCGRELIVQNLSLQTDSTDLLGGYRPLEIKHLARNVYQTFVDLFTGTFSRKQNAEFLTFASSSLQKEHWMKLSQCFRKAAQLGLAKLKKKMVVSSNLPEWENFNLTADRFEKQRLASASGLAFTFTEGALVDALRTGKWVLLDEINLASSETLQRLCGLLDNSTSSLTLTERGDGVAVKRNSSFRIFAAMNPATDSGKKDLTASIRARFTELFVDELLDPVQLRIVASRYISRVLPANERPPEHTDIIIAVVDLYLQCRELADRVLVDGSGQKPRYTLRTLSRALSATSAIVSQQKLALNRALYEGFNLAFQGPLDEKSMKIVDKLLIRALSIGSDKSLLDHPGRRPGGRTEESRYELIKPFWITKGPLDSIDWSTTDKDTGRCRFILVPSTVLNLRRLARAVASGPWPLLLEGPTSAGKTTLVEYIAARCGHCVVRINNHEHTDVQEYTGGFTADSSGSLKFIDGILVQALRLGYWVILDELNLAPSEVLEALNRLLDDNRELYIPETNETVKPHPSFRLFATQNPTGSYGGRKPLSRAFRNRFVEIQINDIPSSELTTILEKRCGCPPSHAKCLVDVMDSLRQRRSASGIFLGKDGLITPRDLLRWADRGASSKYELAMEGYMLLAERLRTSEEQQCVKEVIETHLKVTLDTDAFYYGNESDAKSFLKRAYEIDTFDERVNKFIKSIAPTRNLLRLVTLVSRCVKRNEPVLLVGDTGCGKTVTIQLLSLLLHIPLHTINCHQTTETSDLIGGLRPVRGRNVLLSTMVSLAQQAFVLMPNKDGIPSTDIPDFLLSPSVVVDSAILPNDIALKVMNFVAALRATTALSNIVDPRLIERTAKRLKHSDTTCLSDDDASVWLKIHRLTEEIEHICHRFNALFEWADGPLVTAMKNGELILLDEISLAEDAVLERLNSVLEPSRTIVLAEKGAVDDNDSRYVKAKETFQLFATMNPGGDFGKRELSPALRSRFTEIWVPPVSNFDDIGLVLEHALAQSSLQLSCTVLKNRIVEYVAWFNSEVCRDSESSFASLSLSLRDILSWAHFLVDSFNANIAMGIWGAYLHGARLMHLDGLGLGGGISSRDATAIRSRAELFMAQQVSDESCQAEAPTCHDISVSGEVFGVHPFWIPLGNQAIRKHGFNFTAPTTARNLFRILRALQVSKPILLEGPPGVGKTTIIGALAEASGHNLVRINLSEQTDMADLIGSDLPVSDNIESQGSLGSSFRWFDGVLLSAIRNGDWVLLDELNLASQSVLEGLNSCLDHRASVFVPELGQSFDCPASFRVFAAQNPMGQGGGRKGLPKSFLNRFTKVYVDSLEHSDLQMIVRSSFPGQSLVDKMVSFNSRVSSAIATDGKLGRVGSPWEFNLRDIFRWCELFEAEKKSLKSSDRNSQSRFRFARDLYLNRFRTIEDRELVKLMYDTVFDSGVNQAEQPTLVVSERFVKIGDVHLPRIILSESLMYDADDLDLSLPVQLFESAEAVARCLLMGWPCLLVGKATSGKTTIVHTLAKLTNSAISEISLSPSSDVSELIGCFERDDDVDFIVRNANRLISITDCFLIGSLDDFHRESIIVKLFQFQRSLQFVRGRIDEVILNGLNLARLLLLTRGKSGKLNGDVEGLVIIFREMSEKRKDGFSSKAHFSWKDGALVKAMKEGRWLHLRNANLCSSSVLDRLNSVLEPRGCLLLAESGTSDDSTASKHREIRCHPNFRVFLSMNPEYGEVSRAMRNRCVEVSILERTGKQSVDVLDSFRAVSMAGLRTAQLADTVLQPLIDHTNISGSDMSRTSIIGVTVFASLVSRGVVTIKPLLQNNSLCTSSAKVNGNLIEPIPFVDGINNWALFPESNTIQFRAMVVRVFVRSMGSFICDRNVSFSAASILRENTFIRETTVRDVFLPFSSNSGSICVRDHLISLLITTADEDCLSSSALNFEQLSGPEKTSIKFFADSVQHIHKHQEKTPVGEPTSERAIDDQVVHFVSMPIVQSLTRRIPQLLKERIWLEEAQSASTIGNFINTSVLDVSYNISCGDLGRNVIDCPVTPFLWIFFQSLDELIQSTLRYASTFFDDGLGFALLMGNFLKQRDGLWNLVSVLKFQPMRGSRPGFAVDDFIAQWLLLRIAFEKLLPSLVILENTCDVKGRLDVTLETIEMGIFSYAKGDMLCGSTVMRHECAPTVPRRPHAWRLLLKTRSICRMCHVDRRSILAICDNSMMTIPDCYENFPVVFVLNDSLKNDVLAALCTIQMADLQEVSNKRFATLFGAVGEVPPALESHLLRLLNTFQSELNVIRLKRLSDGGTFDVEQLVGTLEESAFIQNTYMKISDNLLSTFADIQIAACFESWCEIVEADFVRVFCHTIVVEEYNGIHKFMESLLALLRKFVNVAISQSLWDLADLQPYQTIIWLCEGSRMSDNDWRCCIKKLMPIIFYNTSKRTWQSSLDLHQRVSFSLELPSINYAVDSADFSTSSLNEKATKATRRIHCHDLTMSWVLSMLCNAFHYDDSPPSGVKFVTIENYTSREAQSCRLVELLSSYNQPLQYKPFDVVLLFNEIILGLSELLPNEVLLGLKSFVSNPQVIRDKTREELLELSEGSDSRTIQHCISHIILPLLNCLEKLWSKDSSSLISTNWDYALAKIYIGLLRFHLLLPTSPIDPGQYPLAEISLINRRLDTLGSEILALQLDSISMTGQSFSGNIAIGNVLTERNELVSKKLELERTVIERPQTARAFSELFDEALAFSRTHFSFESVLSLQFGISSIVVDDKRDSLAHQREHHWQSTTESFCDSLLRKYEEYEDIVVPIVSSIGIVKQGLQLLLEIKDAEALDDVRSVVDLSITFPICDVSSTCDKMTTMLQHGTYSTKESQAFRCALSQSILSQIVLQSKITSFDSRLLKNWLWVLDNFAEQLNEGICSSRQNEISDDDQEKDFNVQFPNHRLEFIHQHEDDEEDVTNWNDGMTNVDEISLIETTKISESFREVVCFLHQMLFGNSKGALTDFYRIKMFRLCFITAQKTAEHFENNSKYEKKLNTSAPGLVMALSLMSPVSQHLIMHNRIFEDVTDFHRDPNPLESMKAGGPLRRLMAKVTQLMIIFPENTVLDDIAKVCDRVSKLDLHYTSLGRVLTGLEVILKHAQDWEQHASVRVRLGDPLIEIGRLITSWRKLELQSWAELLSSREARFARRGREHWTRIHFMLRRFITTSTKEQSSNSCKGTPRWVWKGIMQNVDRLTNFFPKAPEELWSIMKVLDTFCLTSPMGEFHARLQLLKSFACQVSIESSIRPSHYTLRQLSLSLHSMWQYYNQFSILLSTILSNQRAPFETRLEQEIKLAKWDEQTYYAMAESTERNHRKLMNILYDFDKVLVVNVMSYIEADLSKGVQSEVDADTDNTATVPGQKMMFPLESLGEQISREIQNSKISIDNRRNWTDASFISSTEDGHFYKLEQLSHRMKTFLEKSVGSLETRGSVTVNGFCEAIFERIEFLRSEKTTRPMKERALTDLLKELKRQGYASTKWSIPSEMQHFAELFQLPCPIEGVDTCQRTDPSILDNSELYYQRCVAELYRFRAEISLYGSEHMTARQLEMMLAFGEHGFFLSLQQRCIVSCIVSHRKQLADSITTISGASLTVHQRARKDEYLTLRKEYAYIIESVRQLVLLIKSSKHFMATAMKRQWSDDTAAKIEALLTDVATPFSVELSYVSIIEINEVERMKENLVVALHCIKTCHTGSTLNECLPEAAFSACENQIGILMDLVSTFLNDVQIIDMNQADTQATSIHDSQTTHMQVASFSKASSRAIESALLFAQTCLQDTHAISIETDDQSATSIWDLHRATAKTWKVLNVQRLLSSFQSVLTELSAIHETDGVDKCTRDYCTSYASEIGHLYSIALAIHDKILIEYVSFYRSTTKLQYILLRIFRVLRSKGFCSSKSKEIDKQENDDGTTSGMTFEDDKEGTGMGEGDGKTDVTDQLENEEQLLGLKSDKDGADPTKPPPDPKQLNKEEADQGMEMEGDFDGEMYDIPEKENVDVNDENDSKNDEEEVDREMGEDGSPNEEVIDEKLWDEDDDDNMPDNGEEKLEQNSSVKGDGAADEMITKDENEGKDESNDKDSIDPAQPFKESDTADDEESGKINEDTDDNYEENQGVNVRDDTQLNEEHGTDGIDLDENISIDEDADKNRDEMDSHIDEPMEGEKEEEDGTTNDAKELVPDDSNAESENENEAEPVLEANSAIGSIQPPDNDDCLDEETPIDEPDQPKLNLPKDNVTQSGLGVRDKDGGDALQDDGLEESEETQKEVEGKGEGDGGEKTDFEPSDGGQGAGSEGQGVSDASHGATEQPESYEIPNPVKSPGDASKFWHRKLNMIKSLIDDNNGREDNDEMADGNDGDDEGIFEYTNEKQQNATQTLGEAEDNDVIELDQKEEEQENEHISTDKAKSEKLTENSSTKVDRNDKSLSKSRVNQDTIEDTPADEIEKDFTDVEKDVEANEHMDVDVADEQIVETPDEVSENLVISDLLQFRVDDDSVNQLSSRQSIVETEQSTGHSTSEISDAATRWSMIQGETHHLSRRLCEKLRLVMEPLVASKLRGDYRTGKRINMKRVIGYIASGYRKDKIWLRRTKPAKRNYRVLVAVDDSESMFKNGAGDMALKAMATLATGMSQLEVGEVGIASFGNEMNLIHPFELPFTSESGANIAHSFQFKQQRTRTALCIESAMLAMEGHPGDHGVMQLVFMISDGRIERDSRSSIRKFIREMMEQNILLVLIIVEGSDSRKDSIMNMKEVTFEKGKPQFKHFIEDYPFPYYIVLNDMQALPEVLGDALKQWFEMLARMQSNTL